MNNLPFEVLRRIGSFLYRKDRITCWKVCKLWYKVFRPLAFEDVVFINDKQVANYLKVDPSLRRLTIAIEFDTNDITGELEQLAKSTPYLKTLIMPRFEAETLSDSTVASIIQQNWSAHLVKIDLENYLLLEVLPFLNHQLEKVTESLACFFDKSGKLLPMPQLTAVEIHCGFGEPEDPDLTIGLLNDMRIAYPLLESIKFEDFRLNYLENDNTAYTPFPFVQSLHLDSCTDGTDSFVHWKKMFNNLKVFKTTYYLPPYNIFLGGIDSYEEIFTANPGIVDLKIKYFDGMAKTEGFLLLQKLTNLRKVELDRQELASVITQKELLDFGLLMSSIPKVPWLKIDGLFYISTGESLENYLSGTVGYNETSPSLNYQRNAGDRSISTTIKYENINHYLGTYGNGEELQKSSDTIITVKKKMPHPKKLEPIPMYLWNENKPKYRIPDSPIVNATYSLTTLLLKDVMLRNPTYKWIAQHLPLLKTFHVENTEPYPFCEIVLGENIKSFLIWFDTRYESYKTPIIRLINDNLQNERTVAWIQKQKVFQEMQPLEELGLSTYAITVRFKSIPKQCRVCYAYDVSSLMHEMSD